MSQVLDFKSSVENSDKLSSKFYWDNIVIKVEDELFCVPLCEFVNSSEVFAGMFLLPSGPATRSEGQDRDHPIVLEGYKKDEFASLLKVMYPTAGSLISGECLKLSLEKEEWVSVLKLSTIWNMEKIREYAIHSLSTDITVSPIEKILLGRAHRVAAWLDGPITSLANGHCKPTFEDFATLGWETAARILWIKDNANHSLKTSDTLCFRRNAIKCAYCLSSSSLINFDVNCYTCRLAVSADELLTCPDSGSRISGKTDHLVEFTAIQCTKCEGKAFHSISLSCSSCQWSHDHNCNRFTVNVCITPVLKEMIENMFGEEIKDYELSRTMA